MVTVSNSTKSLHCQLSSTVELVCLSLKGPCKKGGFVDSIGITYHTATVQMITLLITLLLFSLLPLPLFTQMLCQLHFASHAYPAVVFTTCLLEALSGASLSSLAVTNAGPLKLIFHAESCWHLQALSWSRLGLTVAS